MADVIRVHDTAVFLLERAGDTRPLQVRRQQF